MKTHSYRNKLSQLQHFRMAALVCLSGIIGIIFPLLLGESIHPKYGLLAMIGSIVTISICSRKYLDAIDSTIESLIPVFAILGLMYCLEGLIIPIGASLGIKKSYILLVPWYAVIIWMIRSVSISRKILHDKEMADDLQKQIEEHTQFMAKQEAWRIQFKKDHPDSPIGG